jgi:hypothetical protein
MKPPLNAVLWLSLPGKLKSFAWVNVLILMITAGGSGAALGAPCVAAIPTCAEWISLPPGSGRSLVYSTHPLTTRNDKITRALILVHGRNRDADNYFRTAASAALLGGAIEDTVVITPHFASNSGRCRDALAANEINWDCGRGGSGDWHTGAAALSDGQVSSFDLIDRIVTQLAERKDFPNLRLITVAGFSAGGQFVNRYQAVNLVQDKVGVPVTYVVGSPSSYLYPDSMRPEAAGGTHGPFADASNCASYDQWPYGLANRTGYAAKLTDDQIRKQLISRPVTYLVGDLETPHSPALDRGCSARAQGASRLTRAREFFRYITEKYGAKYSLVVVPQCGHSGRCVLTSDRALPILFPNAE